MLLVLGIVVLAAAGPVCSQDKQTGEKPGTEKATQSGQKPPAAEDECSKPVSRISDSTVTAPGSPTPGVKLWLPPAGAASPVNGASPSSGSASNTIGWKTPAAQAGDQHRQGVVDVYLMLEYRRDEIKYTGQPTNTNVFPNPVPPFFPPDQPIHFIPGAFEPNDEQLTGYVSARVKDFGFERLRFSTQVSFRYWGDLDGTTDASVFGGLRDAFVGRRVLEPLSFYTDASGFLTEDRQVKFNLRVGRQFVYGAESVRMDGATFSINHPRFDLDVFGGRRTTFFSDPRERAVVGHNFLVRATPRTTLRYDFLHYVDNSNRFEVRHSLGESWILEGNFFLLNDSPVDLGLAAHYLPYDGKTRMVFSFLKKLTSDDFIYDYTYRAFARNPENQIRRRFFPLPPPSPPLNGNRRVNLLQVNPYTQFYFDAYRNLSRAFGAGASVWVRRVDDSDDAGPFDNTFQEVRVNGDWFPSSAFELGGEYRFRNLSRAEAHGATQFPDIRREGETTFHELYGNGAVHLYDNRVTIEGGLFYRRFSTQSRLMSLEGVDSLGFTGGVKWRIARGYKVLVEYGIDNELPFINPDIDYTQSFRVRFEWRFSR